MIPMLSGAEFEAADAKVVLRPTTPVLTAMSPAIVARAVARSRPMFPPRVADRAIPSNCASTLCLAFLPTHVSHQTVTLLGSSEAGPCPRGRRIGTLERTGHDRPGLSAKRPNGDRGGPQGAQRRASGPWDFSRQPPQPRQGSSAIVEETRQPAPPGATAAGSSPAGVNI